MSNKMSKGYYGSERHKKAIRDWAERNPERMRGYDKKSYHKRKLENPKLFYAKKIWKERRRVAIKNGVPFEVSFDYILSLPSDNCPVFNTPLEWGSGSHLTASLDRVIPALGYVEGNVVWMSLRANTLKRDATQEEISKLSDWFSSVSV